MLGSPGMPIFGTSHRRALELTLGWRALRSKMAQSMALALRSVIGSPGRDSSCPAVGPPLIGPSSRQDRLLGSALDRLGASVFSLEMQVFLRILLLPPRGALRVLLS